MAYVSYVSCKSPDFDRGFYCQIMISAILMNCMYPQAVSLIKKAVKEENPVAALRASVAILAHAGVLKGKKYAYKHDSKEPEFRGAIYSGMEVVRDGNIITAKNSLDTTFIYEISVCYRLSQPVTKNQCESGQTHSPFKKLAGL